MAQPIKQQSTNQALVQQFGISCAEDFIRLYEHLSSGDLKAAKKTCDKLAATPQARLLVNTYNSSLSARQEIDAMYDAPVVLVVAGVGMLDAVLIVIIIAAAWYFTRKVFDKVFLVEGFRMFKKIEELE